MATAHRDIHPDLEAEQAYIVAAYDYLAAMQGRTGVVLRAALDDARRGDVNADAQAMHLGKRLAQLDVGGLALCFGRIALAPSWSSEVGTISGNCAAPAFDSGVGNGAS